MTDTIFFMHDDVPKRHRHRDDDWTRYFARLREAGAFEGGSAIGDGICVSQSSAPPALTRQISGYIRVRAENLAAVRELVIGNPVYETGGTVEIRELPRTGGHNS
jgi:hypothetical protein